MDDPYGQNIPKNDNYQNAPPNQPQGQTSFDIPNVKKNTSPFTPEQEERIKELIGEAFEYVGKALKIHFPKDPKNLQDALEVSRDDIMGKDPYVKLDQTFFQSSIPQHEVENEMKKEAMQASLEDARREQQTNNSPQNNQQS